MNTDSAPLLRLLILALLPALVPAYATLYTVDYETQHVLLQSGTRFDAEIAEERPKATVIVTGSGLLAGMKVAFKKNCSEVGRGSYKGQDNVMLLDNVPSSGVLKGTKGTFLLTINQTHTPYRMRKICVTSTAMLNDYAFNDTGLTVSIFEITAIAQVPRVYRKFFITQQIRTYQHRTVVYRVDGQYLSDRLQLSLQFSCRNSGFTIPDRDQTPSQLYSTNLNGSSAYVQFARIQTDLAFTTKDICVSRGAQGTYDFSGWTGVTMTVFPDCVEEQCRQGACLQTTGNCMCNTQGTWTICPGDNRNITTPVNQTRKADPLMCKDIKWSAYNPDRALNQFYVINPTGNDRFQIMCDMEDGGWSTIPVTYTETQMLLGGRDDPACLLRNFTYDITARRMTNLRNLTKYIKQEARINCRSKFSDFACPREPYHTILEGYWFEWTFQRLWPVYLFDGCCYGCCSEEKIWGMSTATFWSINLPIRQVCTYYGGQSSNYKEVRIDMQVAKFY